MAALLGDPAPPCSVDPDVQYAARARASDRKGQGAQDLLRTHLQCRSPAPGRLIRGADRHVAVEVQSVSAERVGFEPTRVVSPAGFQDPESLPCSAIGCHEAQDWQALVLPEDCNP